MNNHNLDMTKLIDTTDGVKYVDARGCPVDFHNLNYLYVKQPYQDLPFCPFKPALVGDVGRDIPVRIKGMRDVATTVKLSIHRDYYINWDEGWVDIPGESYAELPSGIHIKLPADAWGLIKTRSSTGWKRRLYVFEGTIDHEFTGMLCCLVFNPHREPVRIYDGDKLAQFILVPRYPLEYQVYTDTLPVTMRGEAGFGSTDKEHSNVLENS